MREGSISLTEGAAQRLDGPTEVGSGMAQSDQVSLSQIIDALNERFGTNFNQADQLFFDPIVEAAVNDEGVRQAAAVNPGEKFDLVFRGLLQNFFAERMEQNDDTFVRFTNDQAFQHVVTDWMSSEVYRLLRAGPHESMPQAGRVPQPQPQMLDFNLEKRKVCCLRMPHGNSAT